MITRTLVLDPMAVPRNWLSARVEETAGPKNPWGLRYAQKAPKKSPIATAYTIL